MGIGDRLSAAPKWLKVVGVLALVLLVIVPIFQPVASDLVDKIGVDPRLLAEADDQEAVDLMETLLHAAVVVTFWAALFGAIGLVIRLGWVRLTSDRSHLSVAWRRFRVGCVDGHVESASKSMFTETRREVETGRIVGSSATHYDDFVVRDATNRTWAFRTVDLHLDVAPGNWVRVIQLDRGRSGRVIAVQNRTSGHLIIDKRRVRKLVRGVPGTSFLVVVAMLGSLAVSTLGDSDWSVTITFASFFALVGSFLYERIGRTRLRSAIGRVAAV